MVTFDIASFRQQFPAFALETVYPDATLEALWEVAQEYVNPECSPLEKAITWGLFLMLAHLLILNRKAASGKGGGGFKTYAMIDKVATQYLAPPSSDQFEWWLNQTPYGQQLLALLQLKCAGGFTFGGLPEKEPFTRVYGVHD